MTDLVSTPQQPVEVFAGYAFRPRCGSYTHGDYQAALDRLRDHLNAPHLVRGDEPFRFTSNVIGAPCIRTALFRALRHADFGIIDISDNNHNVLFEAGFLIGTEVPVQYFKSRRSLDKGFELPIYLEEGDVQIYEDLSDLTRKAFSWIAQGNLNSSASK